MKKCCLAHACNDKPEDCYKNCQTFLRFDSLISNSGIEQPENFITKLYPITENEKMAYERLKEIKLGIKNLVEKGSNLLITSNNRQTGKTCMCIKLLLSYFLEIYPECGFESRGYFINVPEYMNKFSSQYYRNSEEFRELDSILKNVDVVIWDDLIKYPLDETVATIISTYIDNRIRNKKANVFNGLNVDNISDYLGDRLAETVTIAEHINFDGKSIEERLEILQENQKEGTVC